MDIGGGTTDIAVVDDGGVEGTRMFGVGGRSFTHQIAEILNVDFDTAEKYKISINNPAKVVLASAAGIVLNLSGLRLPQFVSSPISQLGSAASPVALLLLGAEFEFRDVGLHRRNLAVCTALRLLVYPGAALSLAALDGLRGPEFAALISMFATPAAVSSFSMAAQMGGNAELAASAVTVTTLLSAGTMFFWIFLFKSLGMF